MSELLPIISATIENCENKRDAEELYTKHFNTMLRTAIHILGDITLAEDVVSESIIKMLPHAEKINSLKCHQQAAYLVTIVRNTCNDYFKTEKKQKLNPIDIYENENNDPLELLITSESYELIVSAVMELPDTLLGVAYLSIVHGHSHKEITELLGISYSNSKKRLSRARKIIKETLAARQFDQTAKKPLSTGQSETGLTEGEYNERKKEI
jgi:RNA polymerase sigma-70 factor (ECF subfamily)